MLVNNPSSSNVASGRRGLLSFSLEIYRLVGHGTCTRTFPLQTYSLQMEWRHKIQSVLSLARERVHHSLTPNIGFSLARRFPCRVLKDSADFANHQDLYIMELIEHLLREKTKQNVASLIELENLTCDAE